LLKLVGLRLLQGAAVLFLVSAITFALLAAAGGDAVSAIGPESPLSANAVNELRRVYGVDQPLHVRYYRWAAGVLTGDLGRSFHFNSPVGPIVKSGAVSTIVLSLAAMLCAAIPAFFLGLLAARWPGGVLDRLSSAAVLITSSTPRIVIALVALAIIVRTSFISISSGPGSMGFSRLLVCAVVLSVPLFALLLAQLREGLTESMREDFVVVARAKGLSEWQLLLKHALRVALNPLITTLGFSFGSLIGGSVIVETVLGWPGLGQLSVTAVRSRDVPLLMAVVLITAAAVVISNFVADILLALSDPRIRAGQSVVD
jgi:peptide/nickel transport system permease protein